MRKKILALFSLGLLLIVMWNFFGTRAETEAPILRVGDRWGHKDLHSSGEAVGTQFNATVDRMEYCDEVLCYVCIYDYPVFTRTVWMTSDWVVLRTHETSLNCITIYSPGKKLYDFPLNVGKEWSGKSNVTLCYLNSDGEITHYAWDYLDWVRKVVSTETITVPAGTFDTYVVEEVDHWNSIAYRLWFSADAKNYVKMEHFEGGIGGEVMTSYELAPQGNGSRTSYLIIGVAAVIGFLCFTIFLYYRNRQGTRD